MNVKKLKIKSILHCPVCINRYGCDSQHRPLLMPCGKSVCENCVQSNLNNQLAFWCPYCCENHKQPTNRQFPFNEALFYLVKNHDLVEAEKEATFRTNDTTSSSSSSAPSSLPLQQHVSPKLKELLDEIGSNSIALDKTIYKGAQVIKDNFARVENEINEQVDRMIDELRNNRTGLIKELKK